MIVKDVKEESNKPSCGGGDGRSTIKVELLVMKIDYCEFHLLVIE